MIEITSQKALTETFLQQKQHFANNTYPSYQERLSDLTKLKAILVDNQQAFIDAMSQDFGHRSADDTKLGDILSTVMGINYAIKKLKNWKIGRAHV